MSEQAIGNIGTVTESYAKGVATAQVAVAVPPTSYGLNVKLSAEVDLDAKILIGFFAAKIGGPIPAEVASFIELALASV